MIRYILTGFLFIIVFFLSLSIGSYSIPMTNTLKIVLGSYHNSIEHTIIMNIRLPRLVFDVLVGSGLSVSGASYQSIFKNPLVSPDILGVANGAAFGAALAILLNLGLYATEFLAFLFGILAVFIAVLLAKRDNEIPILGLVISGIVVGAFFVSLLGMAKYFADTQNQLPQIVLWLLGSFSGVGWNSWPAILIIAVCMMVIYFMRWQLNILSLSDEEAKALGINVALARKIIVVLSTIITAASVSIVGIVGWVGLIIPHISRLIVGSDNVKVIPMTIIIGGIFLLLADDLARNITSGEIPIGILTSFIGAPFFAYLYKIQRGRL